MWKREGGGVWMKRGGWGWGEGGRAGRSIQQSCLLSVLPPVPAAAAVRSCQYSVFSRADVASILRSRYFVPVSLSCVSVSVCSHRQQAPCYRKEVN